MAYVSSRIVLLTFLYFIQGLPYGLQARFLPVYLRAKGHSLTSLGFIKMLLAPWLCKALWAPLIDRYSTKQHWLLWSIGGLMMTCAVTSMIPPDNMVLLCISIFSLNLFAATQDIAVDCIALTLLPPDELGTGNTAQVVGYKIGAIFGGGILVWFMDVLGWSGLFIALTLLYIEAILFVYLSPTLRVLKRIGLSKKTESKLKGKQKLDAPKECIPHDKKEYEEGKSAEIAGISSNQLESESVETLSDAKKSEGKTKTEEQDMSTLLKSAIDFVEAKDEFEKQLESRLSIPVNEMRKVDQEELVQEILASCPDRETSVSESKLITGKSIVNSGEQTPDSDSVTSDTEVNKRTCESENREEKVEKHPDKKNVYVGDSSEAKPQSCHNDEQSQGQAENLEPGDDNCKNCKNDGDINTDHESRANTDIPHIEGKKQTEGLDDSDNDEFDFQHRTKEDQGQSASDLGYLDNDDLDPEDKIDPLDLKSDPDTAQGQQDEDEEEEDDVFLVEESDNESVESELHDSDVCQSDEEDSFTCSSMCVSGRFTFLWDVISVPNTGWIMVYVVLYKLGEQGALGMLPLFLVDRGVKAVDVTFWTGVVGQATSMVGSCLGGWILSHPVYKLPCRLLIYQLSLCRLLPLGLLLWVVLLWSGALLSDTILYRAAIVAMNLLLLVSGMVTTGTFTLMMECSRQAPLSVQATHYTVLSSLEVFGKLAFMSVCGALVDYFGYITMYLCFVLLSAGLLPWLWRYPDILCEKVKMS